MVTRPEFKYGPSCDECTAVSRGGVLSTSLFPRDDPAPFSSSANFFPASLVDSARPPFPKPCQTCRKHRHSRSCRTSGQPPLPASRYSEAASSFDRRLVRRDSIPGSIRILIRYLMAPACKAPCSIRPLETAAVPCCVQSSSANHVPRKVCVRLRHPNSGRRPKMSSAKYPPSAARGPATSSTMASSFPPDLTIHPVHALRIRHEFLNSAFDVGGADHK